MKKVKIMLIAVSVVAVAGGTLAFKAAKFNLQGRIYTCSPQNTCSLAPIVRPTLTLQNGTTITNATIVTTTTPAGKPCTNNCRSTFQYVIEP